MRILIVGAGATAYVIMRCLIRDRSVNEIVCGSRDLKTARAYIPRLRQIRLLKLDASDVDSVSKVAEGMDLVINAASSFWNLTVMKACLNTGANYLDMAAHHLSNPIECEQFRFDNQYRSSGLVGLINTGAAPGISNLLAREGSEHLDEVQKIKIRLVESIRSNKFVSSWSPYLAYDELTTKPVIYESGRWSIKPLFNGKERFFFPKLGWRICYLICQDEPLTLPRIIKTRYVDAKLSGEDIDIARIFYQLGMFDSRPRKMAHSKVVPKEFLLSLLPATPTPREWNSMIRNNVIEEARFGIVVQIEGKKGRDLMRSRLSVMFPSATQINKRIAGATYVAYGAGVAAAIFAKKITHIEEKGVLPPEALSKSIRSEILSELEPYGIRVDTTLSKVKMN